MFKGRKTLNETLFDALGYSAPKGMKVLSYAPPNNRNKEVITHYKANEYIQKCYEDNALGQCIHITGNMRAINDSYHANLCKIISRQSNVRFQFSYIDQEEPDNTALNILSQKMIMWGNQSIDKTLISLRSEANQYIEVFSTPQNLDNGVQFTVFVERFILLQSKHYDLSDGPKQKHIWLLKSENLYQDFLTLSLNSIKKSDKLNEHLLKKVVNYLTGFGAKIVLKSFDENGHSSFDQVHSKKLSDYCQQPSEVIKALTIARLINPTSNGDFKITDSGKTHAISLLKG